MNLDQHIIQEIYGEEPHPEEIVFADEYLVEVYGEEPAEPKPEPYVKTHIGTQRYKCLKTDNGFPVRKDGNYESLLSFKALPPYQEFKKHGRKWIYTKNYQPIMDRIVLDVDCENLEKAYHVTKSIMQELRDCRDCINVYFSGSKGFHIEILTDPLDIIDTNAAKPMNACPAYVNFLKYWMDKYPEVDLSLKDVGTRIIRIHHSKHEKTGNFKVLVDINAGLDDIFEHSRQNIDMCPPKNVPVTVDGALNLLRYYSLDSPEVPLPTVEVESYEDVDRSIFVKVFNELNTNIHNKILLLGAGLNGYVDKSELEAIYDVLAKNTDIEKSTNSKGSFIEAYEGDQEPCNLGALRNHYTENGIDLTNFYKLSDYLEYQIHEKGFKLFNAIFEDYEGDWYKMLETQLYDYINNTENVFKGIIHSLMALYGYGSRMMPVNGGASIGKDEFVKVIRKLMPHFIKIGSSSAASVRRSDLYDYDKKIVYIGDKSIKGQSNETKEEMEQLYEVFGVLVSDGEYYRDVVDGGEKHSYKLISSGVCVFYTGTFTNLRTFGAGDQYVTRSTFITINPTGFEGGKQVFLQDKDKVNSFYELHKNYIFYILDNPCKLQISDEVKISIYESCEGNLRTAYYYLGLFKAYCQYLRIIEPTQDDVEDFLKVFDKQYEVNDIEYLVYEKLYFNLNALDEFEMVKMLDDDGSVFWKSDMLTSTKDRKDKSFFTAKQIKTYFKNDFKHNKNLKDVIDVIPDILNNLYFAGIIEKLEWQDNGQNVYWIPKNEDMEKLKEEEDMGK